MDTPFIDHIVIRCRKDGFLLLYFYDKRTINEKIIILAFCCCNTDFHLLQRQNDYLLIDRLFYYKNIVITKTLFSRNCVSSYQIIFVKGDCSLAENFLGRRIIFVEENFDVVFRLMQDLKSQRCIICDNFLIVVYTLINYDDSLEPAFVLVRGTNKRFSHHHSSSSSSPLLLSPHSPVTSSSPRLFPQSPSLHLLRSFTLCFSLF